MPKGILEFNLPEDREDFEIAQNGNAYRSVLWDMDVYLRQILKYESDSHDKKTIDELQKVRDKLHELLGEDGLSL